MIEDSVYNWRLWGGEKMNQSCTNFPHKNMRSKGESILLKFTMLSSDAFRWRVIRHSEAVLPWNHIQAAFLKFLPFALLSLEICFTYFEFWKQKLYNHFKHFKNYEIFSNQNLFIRLLVLMSQNVLILLETQLWLFPGKFSLSHKLLTVTTVLIQACGLEQGYDLPMTALVSLVIAQDSTESTKRESELRDGPIQIGMWVCVLKTVLIANLCWRGRPLDHSIPRKLFGPGMFKKCRQTWAC